MERNKIKSILFVILIIPIVVQVLPTNRIIYFYDLVFAGLSWPILLIYLLVSWIFKYINKYLNMSNKRISIYKYTITIILTIVTLCLVKYSLILKDIPYVLESNFKHAEGDPQNVTIERSKGSIVENFVINGVHFYIREPSMGISSEQIRREQLSGRYYKYKIEYLPYTKEIISIKRIK